jgi:hypothetical protein
MLPLEKGLEAFEHAERAFFLRQIISEAIVLFDGGVDGCEFGKNIKLYHIHVDCEYFGYWIHSNNVKLSCKLID